MKDKIKSLILFTILSMVLTIECSAQQDSNSISIIKNYIHFVDSFYHFDNAFILNKRDTSSYFATKIEEGYFIDSNLNYTGWWDITTISDTKKDSVFKISIVNISYKTKIYLNKYFYYKSNKLIYAEFELRDKMKMMEVKYSSKEFYSNGKVIFKDNKINSPPPEYEWLKEFSMFNNGNEYLDEYLSSK